MARNTAANITPAANLDALDALTRMLDALKVLGNTKAATAAAAREAATVYRKARRRAFMTAATNGLLDVYAEGVGGFNAEEREHLGM